MSGKQKRASYSKHEYSGPVNKKKSAAALKQHNGPQVDKRSIAWRKSTNTEGKENRESSELNHCAPPQPKEVKTYKPVHKTPVGNDDQIDGNKEQITVPSKHPTTDKVNVNWPTPDPMVEDHQLIVSIGHKRDFGTLGGYRVVDIKHVLDWSLSLQLEHSRECTQGQIEYVDESRLGMASTFIFKCIMCNKIFYKSSDPQNNVDKSFVWGTLTAGSHFSQATQLLSTMDLPTMSAENFRKIELDLGKVWEDQLWTEMKTAAQEEREAAIAQGHLCGDGIPYILVYVDGGWSKRTYGHNFNSSSGIACIIGALSKKCLFIGVRNKYCSMCALNEKSGTDKEHLCFRNYQGSSTGMEADILVEGFSKSVEMHNLRYTSFVGDGDSSVFARLKEKVPYGNLISKMECKNHVLKNYTSSLYKIAADTKLSLPARKMLRVKLPKLITVARINMKQSSAEKMRADLKNGPSHVFGEHRKCESYYCRWKEAEEKNAPLKSDDNLVPIMKKDIVTWASIETAVDKIVRKADRLIADVTNNIAENYMSLMAKFTCGKRIHLSRRGSYQRRAHIAGLCQASGQQWQRTAMKRALNKSPGPYFNNFLETKRKLAARRAEKLRKRAYKPKQKDPSINDKEYGPKADDPPPDLEEAELKTLCLQKLQELQIDSLEEVSDIQEKTVGQHGNTLYNEVRKDRLTASLFGMICKRRTSTPCHSHVKAVLYPNYFRNADTDYGQKWERTAIAMFEKEHNKTVVPSGLYIDLEYGFLGASPDGIVIGESAIVEVKTYPSLARSRLSLEDAAREKKNFSMEIGSDGHLQLKKSHNYYYQIQGQLHIAKKELCYLLVFIDVATPLKVFPIKKDAEFIKKMLEKLVVFYKACILPEVILRRVPANYKCREPSL